MRNDMWGKATSIGIAVVCVFVLSVVSWSEDCDGPFRALGPCGDRVTLEGRYQESGSLIQEYTGSQSKLSALGGSPQVYYVDSTSSGGDGSSWQRAFRTLYEALGVAESGSEIRLARGVYKPGPGSYRGLTFQLKNGVSIKGGYPGRNAPDPDARNAEAYPTVLSGDLSGNDGPGFTNNQENCYHVVTGTGTDETAVLDGFTIVGGNASGSWPDNSGAGIINEEGSPTVTNCVLLQNSADNAGGGMENYMGSHPVVSNCVFQENRGNWGGGMGNSDDSSPVVSHCTFRENSARGHSGGGIWSQQRSSPTVSFCTFAGNTASVGWGGGMGNSRDSSPEISNCTFSENSAPEYSGGGVYNQYSSSPTVTHCTFIGNVAGWGGGIACQVDCHPIVSDCTFTDNSAPDNSGGGMYNTESSPTVSRCAFIGNTAGYGGGLCSRLSNPVVTDCVFVGNSATASGGALHNDDESSTVITNCVFSGNSAEDGGGMRNYDSDPVIANCTFARNWAGQDGGGMSTHKIDHGSPRLTNCIFWGNTDSGGRDESAQVYGGTPIVNYCCIESLSGALGGTGNIGSDPLFVDADGADDTAGTQDDDLTLAAGSPCIDAGDNSAVPAGIMSDANGMPRFFDDPGTADAGKGTPPIVDMGAFEFQGESEAVVDVGILYVDQSASGDQHGASWQRGFHSLQAALAVATPGSEIRVAQGIYRPDEDTASPLGTGDRGATFQLKIGVTIKGGYAGADAPDPDARDTGQYPTVLTGDLEDDDGPDFSRCEENSYHVVTADGTDATAVLDGFTITGGYANGLEGDADGAGVYNNDGCATLIDCTFRANQAVNNGGGMYNQGNVTLRGCAFWGNGAMFGGGLYNRNSGPRLINCAYGGNTALVDGAGVYDDSGNPELVNCVFCANTTSGRGGGMLSTGTTNPFLINCTFHGNVADFGGGAVWASSYMTLVNCIVWSSPGAAEGQVIGEQVAVMYSDIQGSEWVGGHNIHLDPLFADPDGLDGVLGTEDDNLRLQGGSPCIDAGRNAWIPNDVATDLDGKPRIVNDIVDLGAYEFRGP
jgi:hypothetical protein